jgi:omega-hydroxy-beta-dihydromenaquinone-9 sulfotransferase
VRAAVQPLYGGEKLADWIRAGGRPDRKISVYFPRLRWHAYWFERNWQTQARKLAGAGLPEDPVFILGPWRSGTTVLHELLIATNTWDTAQTWQCFNPSTCFLYTPRSADRSVRRPMDQGNIRTFGPQEDEFALLLLGEPSIYRGLIDPRRLRECAAELWSPGSGELHRWQTFLRGLTVNAARPLLLKSPSHTFRLPLLKALFPRARFIWIGRHTGELLASNARMWRAMTDRYGLWDFPPAALEGLLQDMVQACCTALTWCLDEMSSESLLWVDFDELRTDRKKLLRRIWSFLRPQIPVDHEIATTGINQALGRVSVHDGSRASMPEDRSARQLENVMTEARRRFGHLERPDQLTRDGRL